MSAPPSGSIGDAMIEQSAARLFSESVDKTLLESFEGGTFPQALWRLVSESGFGLALASEESGGIGESWAGAYPILRGIGYWQVPLPLAETMIASLLLSMAGIEIPEGPITIIEQGLGNTLATSRSDVLATDKSSAHPTRAGTSTGASSLRVDGGATRVPWARDCRWAVLSTNAGDIALLDLHDSTAVEISLHDNHAKIPVDSLKFDGARTLAAAANPSPDLDKPVWTLGAMARSAMIVGALERVLEESLQYANDRVQFGKPIGKNQAIQQQLALLAGDLAASRVAALVAANDAPSMAVRNCASSTFSTAVAKIRCGEAATRGASIAHQVHGAIGFTFEHRLNFATRRLWAWREEFGTDAWWAERLGSAAIATRSAGFWPAMTRRSFDGELQLDRM